MKRWIFIVTCLVLCCYVNTKVIKAETIQLGEDGIYEFLYTIVTGEENTEVLDISITNQQLQELSDQLDKYVSEGKTEITTDELFAMINETLSLEDTNQLQAENSQTPVEQQASVEQTTNNDGLIRFNVKEDAKIYTNEYSAYNQDNGQTFYWGTETVKVELGRSFVNEQTGDVKNIYINNDNYAAEVVELEANGYTTMAILHGEESKVTEALTQYGKTIEGINAGAAGWTHVSDSIGQTNGNAKVLKQ